MNHEHWLIALKFIFAVIDFIVTIAISVLLCIVLLKLAMSIPL